MSRRGGFRGGSRGDRRGSFSQFNDGDWTCPSCKNVNFARRMECNRCHEERKRERVKKGGIEIGKQAAEKSKGLFSADDWICKTCGNVNWARRGDCNMCNSPRVGILEERTGLGGGFNERQNVEYNKREDSDDEFDVYGRRKRKKGETPRKPPPREVESESSDDEDGDLSKYDLSGDDDDDDEDASKYDLEASDSDGEKKSRSRSRSRSRSSSRSRSRSPLGNRRTSSSSNREGRKHSRSRSPSPSNYKQRRH